MGLQYSHEITLCDNLIELSYRSLSILYLKITLWRYLRWNIYIYIIYIYNIIYDIVYVTYIIYNILYVKLQYFLKGISLEHGIIHNILPCIKVQKFSCCIILSSYVLSSLTLSTSYEEYQILERYYWPYWFFLWITLLIWSKVLT